MASNPITMHSVVSSQISFIGYDYATKELYITFKNNGSTYKYLNVPEEVFKTLQNSTSIGKEFNIIIKNVYQFIKVN